MDLGHSILTPVIGGQRNNSGVCHHGHHIGVGDLKDRPASFTETAEGQNMKNDIGDLNSDIHDPTDTKMVGTTYK